MTETVGTPIAKQSSFVKKITLAHHLAPGDVLVMTAALESLHVQFPGCYQTDVDTSCPDIFLNNPHIKPFTRSDGWYLNMNYPLISSSHVAPVHFMHGFIDFLGSQLEIPLRLQVSHPCLYLSDEEKDKPLICGKYWLINAGVKTDYTAKQYGNYQDIVNLTKDKISWVQIGNTNDLHPALIDVIDQRGQTTTTRQLIRLAYHAQGGIGCSTFLQHIFAAFSKPYVCLVGGREPRAWVDYPSQITMSTQGQLTCCTPNACWKSRVVKLNDQDVSKNNNICTFPTFVNGLNVGKCMQMIKPQEVVAEIDKLYDGGVLTYD